MALVRWLASIGLVLGVSAAQAAPIEAYGVLPSLDDLTISPDGKYIAFSTDVGASRAVVIKSIDDGKTIAGLGTGAQKLRSLTWAGSNHLLIMLSTTGKIRGVESERGENNMVENYNLTTHQVSLLLGGVEGALNVVTGRPQARIIDGHPTAFVPGYLLRDERFAHVFFTIDLDTGATGLAERGSYMAAGWLVDAKGNIVTRTEYDEHDQRWRLELWDDKKGWVEVYGVAAPIDLPSIQGLAPDGMSVYVDAVENGVDVSKQVRLDTGAVVPAMNSGLVEASPIVDPASDQIIGTVGALKDWQYRFFDPADQQAWATVAARFAGESVQFVGWSADRKRVIVLVSGQHDGVAYELFDRGTGAVTLIDNAYHSIAAADVAAVSVIDYTAADGRKLVAYLTLPNGKPAKNLPLIVLPHGGPAARDLPGFDWAAQALASRGYAVLQPQFRGSDGFGYDYLAAGFGEWGRKMQTDLSDGVRSLAAQGVIDAKRVCIAGISYGGYAALAGATLEHGVYRCVVADAPVSDPHTLLQWVQAREHESDSLSVRFTTRFMGVENADDPKLSEISPLVHAASADIPVLLIHGKDDTVVPFKQSQAMADALKAAGKPVTLVTLDGEDHWLSRSATRQQMLQATVTFLEANNPPN